MGKKLAERLSLELSTKLSKLAWIQSMPQIETTKTSIEFSKEETSRKDLSSALTNLGYQPNQIKNIIDKLFLRDNNSELSFESLLRLALKEISGRVISSGTQETSLV